MAKQSETAVTAANRRAILEALRKLGDAAEPISVEAVEAGGKVFAEEMKRRAPVDTGSMKSRIEPKVRKKKGWVSTLAGAPPESVFTEYGFIHNRTKKRIEAKPWIRPAFEAKADEVEKAVMDKLKKGIEEAAKREAGSEDAGS